MHCTGTHSEIPQPHPADSQTIPQLAYTRATRVAIVGVTALSYDEDIHDSLLKHFSYITHAYVYMPIPNNPTAYAPVTRVAIVGVTALSYDEDVQCNHCC